MLRPTESKRNSHEATNSGNFKWAARSNALQYAMIVGICQIPQAEYIGQWHYCASSTGWVYSRSDANVNCKSIVRSLPHNVGKVLRAGVCKMLNLADILFKGIFSIEYFFYSFLIFQFFSISISPF